MRTATFGTSNQSRLLTEWRNRPDAGYTLLEVLIVLAIVAAVMATAVPMLSAGQSTLALRRAEADLLGYLREARSEAIAQNQDIYVQLDLPNRSIASERLGRRQLGDHDLRIEITTARSLIAEQRSAGLIFFAVGSSSGGRIALSIGNSMRVVDVDWITGLVHSHDG